MLNSKIFIHFDVKFAPECAISGKVKKIPRGVTSRAWRVFKGSDIKLSIMVSYHPPLFVLNDSKDRRCAVAPPHCADCKCSWSN